MYQETKEWLEDIKLGGNILQLGNEPEVKELFDNVTSVWHEDADKEVSPHDYRSEDEYDSVISVYAFEYDPKWNQAIKNAHRLLKKGGKIVYVWHTDRGDAALKDDDSDKYVKGVSPGLVAGLLRKLGYKNVKLSFEGHEAPKSTCRIVANKK